MTKYREYLVGGHFHGQDKLDLLPENSRDYVKLVRPQPFDLSISVFDPINFDEFTETYRRERVSLFGFTITCWVSDKEFPYGDPNPFTQARMGTALGAILMGTHTRPGIVIGKRKG